MSWMQRLYETYEACAANPEFTNPPPKEEGGLPPALMPVSHVSQQAHIQVTIDGEGAIQRAELLPPKFSCVIPATEDSAGRSGKLPPPHPLCDKIRYCAGDYAGNRQLEKAGEKTEFESYIELLRGWCASPQAHPMARAVLAYVEKSSLVHDLVEKGVLLADSEGNLLTAPPPAPEGAEKKDSIFSRLTPRNGVRDQGEALVVWNVLMPGETESRTWENRGLRLAWIAYDAARMEHKALCLVQGEEASVTFKHPRNIRRPGDNAKLISANDNANFTFRGRFLESEQACTVGYEVSQKAHNALRWLIQRQGWRNGEQAVVAWAVSGVPVPHPCEDFFSLSEEDYSDVGDVAPMEAESASQDSNPRDMGQAFALRLGRALRGYKAVLSDTEGIAVMALEAASPGRLSITYYREHFFKEYLDRLQAWQTDLAWPQPVRVEAEKTGQGRGKARTIWQPIAPLPKAIARAAYGRRCDDKLLMATAERLLPCIVDGAPLPRDLVECCVRRACNRVAQEAWEWKGTLAVACALYKGWSIRTRNKEYGMGLDESNSNRDYLYGRLLAVAEYIERTALSAAGETRPTNAERLMQRFADQPCATWRQLEVQLSPYMQRLQGSGRAGLLFRARKTLDAVMGRFRNGDFAAPGKLGGEFLLGYHCHRMALYAKSDNNTPEEDA